MSLQANCVLILSVMITCTSGYFLNDKNNSLYYFNGEKNIETWDNSRTICDLLGADLPVILPNEDENFLGFLKNIQIWTGIRTAADDVSKYIKPDGSDFDDSLIRSKNCKSSTCCAVYIQYSQLSSTDCDADKKFATVCKFRQSFAELKPKLDMIDSIQEQLEQFNVTMDDYMGKFAGIEAGQGELEQKLNNYKDTLSADIEKTITLAENIEVKADELQSKQKEIESQMDSKLSDLQQDVDVRLNKLTKDQEDKFDSLSTQQQLLSNVIQSVQQNVSSGQAEMMDRIEDMNVTVSRQSVDMKDRLVDMKQGLDLLKQSVQQQIKELDQTFDTDLSEAKADIEKNLHTFEKHINETDNFMAEIKDVHADLDRQFESTKKMIKETDARVRELDSKTESKVTTMAYVNTTLNGFRADIEADEQKLKSLKTATYTILSLLVVAVLIQYAYIFRHKISRFNPVNRTANIES